MIEIFRLKADGEAQELEPLPGDKVQVRVSRQFAERAASWGGRFERLGCGHDVETSTSEGRRDQ